MMNNEQRRHLIQHCLTAALEPTFLEIIDESHLHIGHPGAQSGGGHFQITIISAAFTNQPALTCHRLVYAALGDLIGREIHAVRINSSAA